MPQGIGALLCAFIVIAIYAGIIIFVLDVLRRLVRAVEQISRETARQTEILNTLVSAVSAKGANTKLDA